MKLSRTCTTCLNVKPLTEFHTKRGTAMPSCKACRSVYMKLHYLKNRERERTIRKDWYEKNKAAVCEKMRTDRLADPEKFIIQRRLRKYGLTKSQYEEKLMAQKNRCEMCQRDFTTTPYIDHCHATGKTRGLLCSPCNTAFGLYREDVAVLKRSIAYAEKYKK